MKLPVFKIEWTNNPKVFINQWSQLYNYPLEKLYSERILLHEYTEEDIRQLFIWKNGTPLSIRKAESLQTKIICKIKLINDLKKQFRLELFRSEFSNVSAIWKIYLLHLIAPGLYPIFDQHVYRAYHYIQNQFISEIPSSNRQKEIDYFDNYVYFFRKLEKLSNSPSKNIDEALWAFGKFLKSFTPNLAELSR